MTITEKSINLEVLVLSGDVIKIVSNTGEYFYVLCKDGKLVIKEEL